jgi:hypothetical protein
MEWDLSPLDITQIILIPMHGTMTLTSDRTYFNEQLVTGQQYIIYPDEGHTLTNTGSEPSCWMYAIKRPNIAGLAKLFKMD